MDCLEMHGQQAVSGVFEATYNYTQSKYNIAISSKPKWAAQSLFGDILNLDWYILHCIVSRMLIKHSLLPCKQSRFQRFVTRAFPARVSVTNKNHAKQHLADVQPFAPKSFLPRHSNQCPRSKRISSPRCYDSHCCIGPE